MPFSLELRNISQMGAVGASSLDYSLVSEELVSQDINDGTLSNFTSLWLSHCW